MSVAMKLVGFVLGLVALFFLAAGIGRAVGPVESPAAADHGDMTSEDEHERLKAHGIPPRRVKAWPCTWGSSRACARAWVWQADQLDPTPRSNN